MIEWLDRCAATHPAGEHVVRREQPVDLLASGGELGRRLRAGVGEVGELARGRDRSAVTPAPTTAALLAYERR